MEEDLEASYLQPFLPSWSLQKGTQGHPEVLSGVPPQILAYLCICTSKLRVAP